MKKGLFYNIFYMKIKGYIKNKTFYLKCTYYALLLIFSFMQMYIAYGKYPDSFWEGYFKIPIILVLNFLPIILTGCLLLHFLKEYKYSFLITTVSWGVLSTINYLKLLYRNDPFILYDFGMIKEALAVSKNYLLSIDKKISFFILVVIALNLFSILFFKKESVSFNLKQNMVLVVGVVLCIVLEMNSSMYNYVSAKNKVEKTTHTSYYIANGFAYPFIYSIKVKNNRKPEQYNEKIVLQKLSQYEAEPIMENKVNMIAIMREAYYDFSSLELKNGEIESYPYTWISDIRENTYHGKLIVNAFAAGTYDTEWSFLTGGFFLNNSGGFLYRKKTNSYVWYLRRQGYTTEGAHPFYSWSYNRKNVNEYLGFEKYRFADGDFWNITDDYYPKDSFLYDEILNDYKKRDKNKPYFSFSVTMEGHGPYMSEYNLYDKEFFHGTVSSECSNAINNYINLNSNSDKALYEMLSKLNTDEAPIIVVFFADHLPWMGNGNAYWKELGYDFDGDIDEDLWTTKYSTEYFVWANEAAKKVLHSEFVGEGPSISPCYLMGEVFKQCGWEGPRYMQCLRDYQEIVPVIHNEMYDFVNDEPNQDISINERKEIQTLRAVQYFYANTFEY